MPQFLLDTLTYASSRIARVGHVLNACARHGAAHSQGVARHTRREGAHIAVSAVALARQCAIDNGHRRARHGY